jgi:putative transposase
MSVPDAKRLRELETENTPLRKLPAEQVLENDVIKRRSLREVMSAPARRVQVRHMIGKD